MVVWMQVQVIPWVLSDSNYVRQPSQRLEPQKTVFVGALHGMLNAEGLAHIMHDLFDNVVYAGIDTDKHKYPIGQCICIEQLSLLFHPFMKMEFMHRNHQYLLCLVGAQSTMIVESVCQSACISQKPYIQTSQHFLCVFSGTVTQSSDNSGIQHVLLVSVELHVSDGYISHEA